MADSNISVRHLFTRRLNRLHGDSHDFMGPFGRRIFERPRGGTIDGAAIKGEVLDLLATDYGNASSDGTLRQIDANIVAQTNDGVIIFMKVRGRASPAYGPGQSRICLLFTVAEGPYEGRDAGRCLDVIGNKDVEIIARSQHGIAAEPFHVGTFLPYALHGIAFELLKPSRRANGIGIQSRQHDEGWHGRASRV